MDNNSNVRKNNIAKKKTLVQSILKYKVDPRSFISLLGQKPTVLDIRTKDELGLGFIQNSICIPFSALITKITSNALLLSKNERIYILCTNGARSQLICMLMKNSGFSEVFYVDGGVQALQKEGCEMVHAIMNTDLFQNSALQLILNK